MSFLKSISNLFKKNKITIPVVEEKDAVEVKDYKENFGLLMPERALTQEEVDEVQKIFQPDPQVESKATESTHKKSLKELAARVPKRKKTIKNNPPTSVATSIWVSPEFDATPNPKKYWRRFKRNGKTYYKKFYKDAA